MSESKDLPQLWKDYVEKGNSFANWFTSILISNFVYLINIGKERKFDCDGKLDLGFSVLSLVFMFFFKVIGVWAAQRRHDLESQGAASVRDNFLKKSEACRKWLFYLFAGFGIIAIIISGFILWSYLKK